MLTKNSFDNQACYHPLKLVLDIDLYLFDLRLYQIAFLFYQTSKGQMDCLIALHKYYHFK